MQIFHVLVVMVCFFGKKESITLSSFGESELETACAQANCGGEKECGDTFLYRHFADAKRTLLILSDGLGHGDQAAAMSRQAAEMLFAGLLRNEQHASLFERLLTKITPCPSRNVGYATFTAVDLDHQTGRVKLIEYDNPQLFPFRGAIPMILERHLIHVHTFGGRDGLVMCSEFYIRPGDSLVLLTDGVTQSGQGVSHDFGCGRGYVQERLENILAADSRISAEALAGRVVDEAMRLDGGDPKDDLSCAVLRVHAR